MEREDDTTDTPYIAVIGMAGRFPGAQDTDQLWENLRSGTESVRFFSDEELLAAGESPELLADPNYVKACPVLADIDRFDAAFFGLSPRDAAIFDPQHRLFLETAWAAFENAGYVGERYPGPVGVFASAGFSEYMVKNVLSNPSVVESVGEWLIRHLGNDTNFLATRVSYQLNLRGPSMNVQTACSSSLVAIHLAAQSLLNGECDLALAGGSTILSEQRRGYLYKEGEILSPDGHCRAFDARAHGTTLGSASAAVVLKRLGDAQRDGDRVLAVIRGSAINNDGAQKVGYLAPSVEGQARVVAEALAIAGVEADEISYVETHGTGTLIGDPIEIAGLNQAFRATTARKRFCAIGSVKTNVGHSGEAAGMTSFIKTVLALQHRELPPSLFFEQPNPQAGLEDSPFFVNSELRPWHSTGPRRAGVTGLGAGGTNAHVILEEAPPAKPALAVSGPQLLVLSAKTEAALEQASRQLASHLAAHPELSLADVAHTLRVGRAAFAHRRVLVAQSLVDASAALAARDAKRVFSQVARGETASLVFMFPGGGAQYPAMGRDLYSSQPVYRDAMDACLRHVQRRFGIDLKPLLFPAADQLESARQRLLAPSVALPALFATSYALAQLLMSWELKPAALIGHSAGEYVAACLSGVFSFEDGLDLVCTRGRLFETLPKGAMLSISLSAEKARAYLGDELSFAAVNAPGLSVASGPSAAIDALERRLLADEVDCTRVHIDVAAHSSMLEPILAEFERFCRTIRFAPPKIPYVSNLTGTWVTAEEVKDPAYWVRHLRHTVRFGDGMTTLLEDENRIFVEVGPGRTLSSLARQQAKPARAATPTLRHVQEVCSDLEFLLGTVGRVWLAGAALDFDKLSPPGRRRVALPSYPFEDQRYWIEPGARGAVVPHKSTGPLKKRAELATWFYQPGWRSAQLAAEDPQPSTGKWLLLADDTRLAKRLLPRLAGTVLLVSFGKQFAQLDAHHYTVRAGEAADYVELVVALGARGELPDRVVHMVAAGQKAKSWSKLQRGFELHSVDAKVDAYYTSQVLLVQALSRELEQLHWFTVSTGMVAIAGEAESVPLKALLLGPTRVIPREWPQMQARAIDFAPFARGSFEEERLLAELVRELSSSSTDSLVAYRGGTRWAEHTTPVQLDTKVSRDWLRPRAVVLITGGFGGIGLALATYLAEVAACRLVLVGRSALPAREQWDALLRDRPLDDAVRQRVQKVRALEALGVELQIEQADVTDPVAMRAVVERARARFGRIDGVIHAAGSLNDKPIALRQDESGSSVISTKVKGALLLDRLLQKTPPDFFVVFSSVSSLLGLPGQVDYTAANAFLDAFARERALRCPGRTVAIDWNAWQEVGLAFDTVRAARAVPGAHHPLLERSLEQSADSQLFASDISRSKQWLVAEHVVRGAEAVIPGTGFVEIARAAALAHGAETRTLELRDLVFLAPFVVPASGSRELRVRVSQGEITLFSESEQTPHVTGHAVFVETAPPAPRSVPALRAAMTERVQEIHGFLPQSFMDFGPRWQNLVRIHYGRGEALIELALPAAFRDELATFALHPALLDMATGAAQSLLPGFDGARDFFVPFSYGRVVVHAPLTAELLSHVRLHETSTHSGARDTAVFDVTLLRPDGIVLCEITGFTMRRLPERVPGQGASFVTPRLAAPTTQSRPESALEAALREGILPREGAQAFERVLGSTGLPQVVVCSVDFLAWLERVGEQAQQTMPKAAGSREGPQFTRPTLSTGYLAPRNELEREIALMWRDLLGVAEVGVHDDFFELGGQSLIAVRLFSKIRKRFGVELPLAMLFDEPTIAGCAALVASSLGIVPVPLVGVEPSTGEAAAPAATTATRPRLPDGTPFKHVVTIQKGGDRIPFFCVHGAGGNVLNFRDMSRLVDRDQPFYGLQARGIDGLLEPHHSIQEMAQAYLAEVRIVQPHGPYRLGGYSGGGLVAFEMAQLLSALGEQVELLALIDTFYPGMPQRAWTIGEHVETMRRDGAASLLRRAVERRLRQVGQRVQRARVDYHRYRQEPIPFALRDNQLQENFEAVARRFVPRPWSGRATLFRTEETPYMYEDPPASYGWDEVITGGVEVVFIPGNHQTLLLGENAEMMLRRFRNMLNELEAARRLSRAS